MNSSLYKQIKWEDLEREDLKMIPEMLKIGWKPNFNIWDKQNGRITPSNPPHNEVNFKCNNKAIWYNCKIIDKKIHNYWTVFELINGKYQKGNTYNTLEEFLKNEK